MIVTVKEKGRYLNSDLTARIAMNTSLRQRGTSTSISADVGIVIGEVDVTRAAKRVWWISSATAFLQLMKWREVV